jgi:prepilin-type processing-associated H-X9-DG protein
MAGIMIPFSIREPGAWERVCDGRIGSEESARCCSCTYPVCTGWRMPAEQRGPAMRETRFHMTDAIVLVVLCAAVVLTAGAMSIGGRIHAKTVMCQQNLRCIGKALNQYVEEYQGKLPTAEYTGSRGTYITHHYLMGTMNYTTGAKTWFYLGCLFGQGLITDGRTFYCPATKGGLDEYLHYCSPTPWGTLPQTINSQNGTGNEWLRVNMGYLYWPQSKDLADQTYVNGYSMAYYNYKVGYPKTPATADRVDTSKAIVTDKFFHVESQYKANALFWDGSVAYRDNAKAADGKLICFDVTQYGGDLQLPMPMDAGWRVVTIAEWMWQFTK